jgi:DNA-binding NarL/FixJ family response regulator
MIRRVIRVFVVDDHAVVREGIKRIVQGAADMVLIGEAADGAEALARAEREAWDVMLLDLTLPDRSGLDVLIRVKALRPQGKIIVLTMHAEEQYAVRVLRAGADGFLTKGRSSQELLEAIRKVTTEGKYVTGRVAELLLSGPGGERAPHEALSDREMEVLLLLGRGMTPSAVAEALEVKPSTVSTHIRNVKDKLGVESLGDLVQYAVRAGLV